MTVDERMRTGLAEAVADVEPASDSALDAALARAKSGGKVRARRRRQGRFLGAAAAVIIVVGTTALFGVSRVKQDGNEVRTAGRMLLPVDRAELTPFDPQPELTRVAVVPASPVRALAIDGFNGAWLLLPGRSIAYVDPRGMTDRFELEADVPADVLVVGPDGNAWTVVKQPGRGSDGTWVRLTPTGEVTYFPGLESANVRQPEVGKDGRIWFWLQAGDPPNTRVAHGNVQMNGEAKVGPWVDDPDDPVRLPNPATESDPSARPSDAPVDVVAASGNQPFQATAQNVRLVASAPRGIEWWTSIGLNDDAVRVHGKDFVGPVEAHRFVHLYDEQVDLAASVGLPAIGRAAVADNGDLWYLTTSGTFDATRITRLTPQGQLSTVATDLDLEQIAVAPSGVVWVVTNTGVLLRVDLQPDTTDDPNELPVSSVPR